MAKAPVKAAPAPVEEPEAAELPTREELVATVEEVNAVLGLEGKDALVIGKKTTDDEIIEMLVGVTTGQIYESDFEVREGEGEEEGVTFFSEAAGDTLEAIGVEILAGSPPEVAAEPEPAPAKGKGATKPAAAPAVPKEKKAAEPRYTRANAFSDAVTALKADTKVVALDALADEANKQYMKNGNGKDNLKEAKWYQGTIVPALVALDFAEVTEAGFKLK